MLGIGASAFSLEDIPDLSEKVILVTGGNSGLGAESILQLAKHNPSRIYLAARTKSKASRAIEDIERRVPQAAITFLELDLSSFGSIKRAANTLIQSAERLDVLMNNAGIMATPAGLTKDGYEVQFGTNHVGHALLTRLLLPLLQKTAEMQGEHADVRIVTVAAEAYKIAPKGGLVFTECKTDMHCFSTWTRYGQSKLANILYTNELAAHHPDIKCISLHPGGVNTGLLRGPAESYPLFRWPLKLLGKLVGTSVAHGALTQLFAATSKLAKTGTYYAPTAKEHPLYGCAQDVELAKALWDYTERELIAAGY
ncbi:hypothetical protein LTR86_011223 [Recurvomyces mirabilis]|nr:hypothetical protein LTR86_011223 [Recurvomyces mirabilis]